VGACLVRALTLVVALGLVEVMWLRTGRGAVAARTRNSLAAAGRHPQSLLTLQIAGLLALAITSILPFLVARPR